MRIFTLLPIALLASGCTGQDGGGNEQVNVRNLIETEEAGVAPAGYRVEGEPIPTPSDQASSFHLLRTRQPVAGPLVSIVRQQRGERVVYFRAETDCARSLFHVIGVGDTRAEVEVDRAYDGPLRPTEGLPLRRELAGYICEQAGTPIR